MSQCRLESSVVRTKPVQIGIPMHPSLHWNSNVNRIFSSSHWNSIINGLDWLYFRIFQCSPVYFRRYRYCLFYLQPLLIKNLYCIFSIFIEISSMHHKCNVSLIWPSFVC